MSGIDLAILVIIALSMLVSLVRGAAKEVIGLLTWVVAIAVTVFFTARFATLLPTDTIESPTARAGISAAVLFLGTMFIGSVIGWLLRQMMAGTAIGVADRLLGALFGGARGLLIVTLLVLAAHLVQPIKQERWWRESLLLPGFQSLARIVHGRLPPDIARHFDFPNA